MIKINLALRKQAVTGVEASKSLSGLLGTLGGGGGGGNPQLQDLVSNFGDFPWRKVLLPVVVGIGASFAVENYKATTLERLEEEISTVQAEQPKLEAEIQKYKALDAIRKELEADEKVMRAKIDTIKQVIEGQANPPKILRTLGGTVPKEIWLEEFKIVEGKPQLKGRSKGYGPISDFMKSLGESIYYGEMVLKGTQQVKDDVAEDVISFELEGKSR